MVLTTRSRAELYLLSLTIFWGSTFVLTKYILLYSSPLVYISLRFALASIIFFIIYFKRVIRISKDAIKKGSVLGVLLFIGFVVQTIGLKYTTASKSAFITGLMVVFTPIFQLVIERKPPKYGNIIGVIFVALGLYFMTSPQGSEFNIGDGLTLIGAITFGLYTVYLDVYGKEHDPAHLSFVQFISTALLSILAMSVLETPVLKVDVSFLFVLIYLVLIPTIVALYVMAKYQQYTTPTRSVIIYSMEPPFAALFAFFVLGELIGISGVFGGILILCGLITSELSDSLFK